MAREREEETTSSFSKHSGTDVKVEDDELLVMRKEA
jgi:co-chaperonin GroES (HSP10)